MIILRPKRKNAPTSAKRMNEISSYECLDVGSFTDLFTLDELKDYLRMTSNDFDAQLSMLADAGVEFVEAFTGYSLRNRTSQAGVLYADAYRAWYPPVSEVVSGGELAEKNCIIASDLVVVYKSVPSQIAQLKAAAMEYVNQKFNNNDTNLARVREMCASYRCKPTFL